MLCSRIPMNCRPATAGAAAAAPRPQLLRATPRRAAAPADAARQQTQQRRHFQQARRQQLRSCVVVAASGNPDTTVEAGLHELTQETFWEFLETTSNKMTVVDFYTAWCGPCKLIYPELVKMSQEMEAKGVQIVKFECNKDNKELGKSLGIKVAPTFQLYKGREKVAEMTGAKPDKLRELIDANL